jgi:hypothetical protein
MSALLLRNRGSGPVSVLGMIDEQRGSVFGDAETISPDEVEQFITGYRTATAIATERLNEAPPTIAPDARVRPS